MSPRSVLAGWIVGLLVGTLLTLALLPGGRLSDLPAPAAPPRHNPWITFQIPEGYACVCPSAPTDRPVCDAGFTQWTSSVCVKAR